MFKDKQTFEIIGEDKEAGAIGAPEVWKIELDHLSPKAAKTEAEEKRYTLGREHVLVTEINVVFYDDRDYYNTFRIPLDLNVVNNHLIE